MVTESQRSQNNIFLTSPGSHGAIGLDGGDTEERVAVKLPSEVLQQPGVPEGTASSLARCQSSQADTGQPPPAQGSLEIRQKWVNSSTSPHKSLFLLSESVPLP